VFLTLSFFGPLKFSLNNFWSMLHFYDPKQTWCDEIHNQLDQEKLLQLRGYNASCIFSTVLQFWRKLKTETKAVLLPFRRSYSLFIRMSPLCECKNAIIYEYYTVYCYLNCKLIILSYKCTNRLEKKLYQLRISALYNNVIYINMKMTASIYNKCMLKYIW
jgi:hypothetical protein